MRYRSERWLLVLLMPACLLAGGCLRKDVMPTLYLDPDGAVTWTVTERDVRSDERDPASRAAEEQAWLEASRNDAGPQAEALRKLGGRRVRTTVLRDERPFVAVTEARFSSVRRLTRDLLDGFGLDGDVDLERDEAGTTLTVRYDPEPIREIDENDPLLELVDGLEDYRIVLTRGHFVEADGFVIDETKTVARPVIHDDEGKRQSLSLTWEDS